ncbi:MAG: DUF4252 domain-containing protein [Flavobacteriales bacterium]
MKNILLILAFLFTSLFMNAQDAFDSFEDENDVTSVVVTKNMFKLLSKMDLNSSDPEAQEYLNLVNSLNNIKIFTTENPEVATRMDAAIKKYVSATSTLSELMRVKDDGKNIKFYSKEGSDKNHVKELLMHLTGMVDGKNRTVILSITGDIDLKKISKLTEDLNMPGSEELKNLDKKQ